MVISEENQPSKIHTSQLVQIQPEARGTYLRTLRAGEDPTCKFTSLADLLTADFLEECLWELKSDKAPGIDGVTVQEYEANLDEDIDDLEVGYELYSTLEGGKKADQEGKKEQQRGKNG
jgi:hypothetical protein